MEQDQNTPKRKKKTHLSEKERCQIEAFIKAGWTVNQIAVDLGRDRRTIERELRRGMCLQRNSDLTEKLVYRSEFSRTKRNEASAFKGRPANGLSSDLYKHIVSKLLKKFSPNAIIGELRREGLATEICARTIYNLIYSGYFKEILQMSKRRKNSNCNRKISLRNPTAARIDERPKEANDRQPGHWEMDTVVSGRDGKGALLVLTERYSRFELIFMLKACKQEEVIKSLDRLERRFGKSFEKIFKTITCDNGSEFLNSELIKKSVYGGQRCLLYYAHPYSSWERGSNENANKLIRKWIKKGEDISKYTVAYIKRIQDWMNNYPRKLFGYKTANMVFNDL